MLCDRPLGLDPARWLDPLRDRRTPESLANSRPQIAARIVRVNAVPGEAGGVNS
jgi:hypothetical protein